MLTSYLATFYSHKITPASYRVLLVQTINCYILRTGPAAASKHKLLADVIF